MLVFSEYPLGFFWWARFAPCSGFLYLQITQVCVGLGCDSVDFVETLQLLAPGFPTVFPAAAATFYASHVRPVVPVHFDTVEQAEFFEGRDSGNRNVASSDLSTFWSGDVDCGSVVKGQALGFVDR